ncbi:carbohydrate ABC transporter permease [Gynuella sunshinyii]|uniref:ABC-type sugar transport system, permease component n=1 Tax=Gynuella sunshinyii YC6258 TaxID=1445510 RepID=A0A0C5VK38_9GAMM|nr:carbohydrate ABC transporter permease [Gynuella sunshinyii]AJQ95047.1 ABC-type sugar transport system, permease component [Gynuella sunshinyii YC6258]
MFKFLFRTRHPGKVDIADILSWAWLFFGTTMVAIPIAWAILSSFKTEAEVNSFPPSLVPKAAETIELEGQSKPLSVWEWHKEGEESMRVALIRRIGIKATVVDIKNPEQTYQVPISEITQVKGVHFEWKNYTDPLKQFDFVTYIKNTVFVTFVATILTLVLNSMAAFALSKYRFRGKNAIFMLILSTLMLPLSVIMVPAFIVVVGLNLADNLWGVIFATVATPTGVFMLRQYMLTIPDDLIEAARVDAASEFRIYWRVVLPLCAPAIAVLAIFSVIWRWNDFLWPLIVLSSPENYTLQIGLNTFQGQFSVQWHYILAMTVIALLPVTVVFLLLQKYITQGVASSGVK